MNMLHSTNITFTYKVNYIKSSSSENNVIFIAFDYVYFVSNIPEFIESK